MRLLWLNFTHFHWLISGYQGRIHPEHSAGLFSCLSGVSTANRQHRYGSIGSLMCRVYDGT